MNKIRFVFLAIIILLGLSMIFLFYSHKIKTQFEATFVPILKIFGMGTKTIDRVLTRVIPIDSLDEKEFGEAIAKSYETNADKEDTDYIYLNSILNKLGKYGNKPFSYKVYLSNNNSPNAFALPGGVIIITKSLLELVNSEAELVSILLHEMAHIELSHCFDLIRFELLSKKIDNESFGWLADFTVNLLLRHTYSKTTEDEADEYGYKLLLKSKYDPSGFGNAFMSLKKYQDSNYNEESENVDFIRDYMMSHPPLELRIEKFLEKAKIWYKLNKSEKRYLGKMNIENRKSYFEIKYETEWVRK